MGKISLKKVTLNLEEGDKEEIEKYFPNVPYSVVIRQIVHSTVKKLQEKENHRSIDALDEVEIEV